MGSYWCSISPSVWVLWTDQPNWPSQARFPRKWLKIQLGLYLFYTCPRSILQFQFWDFDLGSPNKWLLSLNYWPNDQILFQMAVWLVFLEKSSVLGGMSSHLYHSSMSPDQLEQSVFSSLQPGQSYGGFIIFQRLYQQKWIREITKKNQFGLLG